MEDEKNAYPYLTGSELLDFKPFRKRYVSKNTVSMPESHFVKEGWILLTSSGIVGLPVYAGKNLTKYFLTHDLIRIVPKNRILAGYLYAYLSSWIGKSLVSKDRYGGVVDHIEPHHVQSVPVPKIRDSDIEKIGKKIIAAWRYREKALDMENDAIRELEAILEKNG